VNKPTATAYHRGRQYVIVATCQTCAAETELQGTMRAGTETCRPDAVKANLVFTGGGRWLVCGRDVGQCERPAE
jgi:hypothetical protein